MTIRSLKRSGNSRVDMFTDQVFKQIFYRNPIWDWLTPRYFNDLVAAWYLGIGLVTLTITHPFIYGFFLYLIDQLYCRITTNRNHYFENLREHFEKGHGRFFLYRFKVNDRLISFQILLSLIYYVGIVQICRDPNVIIANGTLQDLGPEEFHLAMAVLNIFALSGLFVSALGLRISLQILFLGIEAPKRKLHIQINDDATSLLKFEVGSDISLPNNLPALIIGAWDVARGWRVMWSGEGTQPLFRAYRQLPIQMELNKPYRIIDRPSEVIIEEQRFIFTLEAN